MQWDVAGIGNALMDALVVIQNDGVLNELGLTRGTMHPVDHRAWETAFERVKSLEPVFHSGGSCANTVATAGRLGSRAIYRGQVGNDEHGQRYAELLTQACGEHRLRVDQERATGKCLSLISAADGERTMLTDLGAAVHLPDLERFRDDLTQARVAHFTGYTLLDGPTLDVVYEAMGLAKSAQAMVSLDAADPFVVHTVPDRFRAALRENVDIAFLNEEEGRVISGTEDAQEGVRKLAEECGLTYVCIKLGKRGSVVWHDGAIHQIPVFSVDVVDTTGAGDAYAGGFLHGVTQGWTAERAGRLASAVAAQTVAQVGAVVEDPERLERVLADA